MKYADGWVTPSLEETLKPCAFHANPDPWQLSPCPEGATNVACEAFDLGLEDEVW